MKRCLVVLLLSIFCFTFMSCAKQTDSEDALKKEIESLQNALNAVQGATQETTIKETEATTESNTEAITEKSEEAHEWEKYYKADTYEKYTTPSSENGLDGTLLKIDGKIEDISKTDSSIFYLITNANDEKWMFFFVGANDFIINKDDEITIYGEYLGVSKKFLDMPIINVFRCKINGKLNDIVLAGITVGTLYEGRTFEELHAENRKADEQSISTAELPTTSEPTTIAPTTDISTTQPITEKPTKSNVSAGQRNAVSKARDYLDYTAFSYQGLIEQLEYEGFSKKEATYGADNCGANWKEQAVLKAKDYLDYTSFSYQGLIEQLEYEGFSKKEATYGADNCGADW